MKRCLTFLLIILGVLFWKIRFLVLKTSAYAEGDTM